MKSIDAHCHLQFDAYAEDREIVISKMKENDTEGIVVGVDLDSSEKAVLLASAHEHLYASVGFHPGYVLKEEFHKENFTRLVTKKRVVAVGECGLDYFREENPEVHAKQKDIFIEQVHMAARANLPLMIHARPSKGGVDAYLDVIKILQTAKKEYKEKLRGNVHFFVGGISELQAFNALDFTVSVTGVITFTNDYDLIIKAVPKTMLLAETDAPYVAPVPFRGKRNEPVYVSEVVNRIAELWDMDAVETQRILFENTKRVFGSA